MIFNKARDEKKTGGKPESPSKDDHNNVRPGVDPGRPPSVRCFLISFFHLCFNDLVYACDSQLQYIRPSS